MKIFCLFQTFFLFFVSQFFSFTVSAATSPSASAAAAVPTPVRPAWLTSPEAECPAGHLCAVGSALGINLAQAQARSEIAKIFKTQVMTQLSASKNVKEQKVEEKFSSSLNEISNQIVEGVVIAATFEDKQEVYAFAQLSKTKAATLLDQKRQAVERKIQQLLDSGTRADILEANTTLEEQLVPLSMSHIVVKGSPFESVAAFYAKIDPLLKEKKLQETIILFDFANPKEMLMQNKIAEELLKMNYKIVYSDQESHKYRIWAVYNWKKEFLNVKGFEKYSFELILKSYAVSGVKEAPGTKEIGNITLTTTETGRAFAQAEEVAIPKLLADLKNKISSLRLD